MLGSGAAPEVGAAAGAGLALGGADMATLNEKGKLMEKEEKGTTRCNDHRMYNIPFSDLFSFNVDRVFCVCLENWLDGGLDPARE